MKHTLHGLRYSAASELAEAGCTDHQIAVITGHKSLSMVQKYSKGANQKRLAKQAHHLREQSVKMGIFSGTAKFTSLDGIFQKALTC